MSHSRLGIAPWTRDVRPATRWAVGLSLVLHAGAVIFLLLMPHGTASNPGPEQIRFTMVFGQPAPVAPTGSAPGPTPDSTAEAPPTHDAVPAAEPMPQPPAESQRPVAPRQDTPLPQQPPIVSPQAAVPNTAPPDVTPPQAVPPRTASQPGVVPQAPEPKPATVPQRAPELERKAFPAATRAAPKAPVAPRSHRPETAATHARSSLTADVAPGRSDASAPRAGSGASAGEGQTHAAADPSWLADVSSWLQAHRSYPEMARAMGRQGTVVVQVTVNPAGHVIGFNLVRGSGTQSLDQAAEALMRHAQLPPFPPDMTLPRQSLTVPIHYQLD